MPKKTMTLNEYQVLRAQYEDNEELFLAEQDRFFNEHTDCPRPHPIKRLSLVMKKEYAEEILTGTKTVEIRDAASKKYCDMLYDKAMLDYEEKHWDDELMRLQLIDFTSNVRPVLSIHFYTYNNSWSLDVECLDNGVMQVTRGQVQNLKDAYNSNEFDGMLADLEALQVPDEDRPFFFYFAIGKILDRRNI